MKTQTTASVPKLFIGIDIHKRSWQVHFRTDLFSGKTQSMPADPGALKKYIDKHYKGHKISTAYEAGCCDYFAHRSFEHFGWHSIVVNPADIPRSAKQIVTKTDAIDCMNISKQLKAGQLRGIYIPGMQREQLRSLFRRRNQLVKELRRIKSRIKAHLLYFGVAVPEDYDNSNWSKGLLSWLEQLDWLYETASQCLGSMLDHYSCVEEQIRFVSTGIRKYCRKHYNGITTYFALFQE